MGERLSTVRGFYLGLREGWGYVWGYKGGRSKGRYVAGGGLCVGWGVNGGTVCGGGCYVKGAFFCDFLKTSVSCCMEEKLERVEKTEQ